MSKGTVAASYVQSLLWAALFFAVLIGVSFVAHLVFFDFIHGNPYRTPGNVISMMVFETPLITLVAVIGFFLVFTLPQLFQAALVGALIRIFGSRARFAVLLALPLTAVLTWYCYDYLTPSDFNLGINVGPEWSPYQHGISAPRYLRALGFQALVTLFSLMYLDAGFRGAARKPMLAATLAIVVVTGGIWGYSETLDQIQLQQAG